MKRARKVAMIGAAKTNSPAHIGLARVLSFIVAMAVSAVLTLDPYVLGSRLSWQIHAGVPLMMTGVSITFAYAFGFKPDRPALRAVFHPLVGWLLLGVGAAVLAIS
jgi:predicted membrane protein